MNHVAILTGVLFLLACLLSAYIGWAIAKMKEVLDLPDEPKEPSQPVFQKGTGEICQVSAEIVIGPDSNPFAIPNSANQLRTMLMKELLPYIKLKSEQSSTDNTVKIKGCILVVKQPEEV